MIQPVKVVTGWVTEVTLTQSNCEMHWEPAEMQQPKAWEHLSALLAGWELPERCCGSPKKGLLQRRRMLGQLTGITGALIPASHWKSKAIGDFLGPGLSERFSIGLAKARAVSASGQEIPAKTLFGQSPGGRINPSGFANPRQVAVRVLRHAPPGEAIPYLHLPLLISLCSRLSQPLVLFLAQLPELQIPLGFSSILSEGFSEGLCPIPPHPGSSVW